MIPCFTVGTLIETEEGFLPAETLHLGTKVITRDRGPQPIRWIGTIQVSKARLQEDPRLKPIRIAAGALGDGGPFADLLVSPQHRILIRSRVAERMFSATEVLIPAGQLVALPGISIEEDCAGVTYLHILLDDHEVLMANGAATESLYLGREARKTLSPAARAEIDSLFSHLHDTNPLPVRLFARGGRARRLTDRHVKNDRSLFSAVPEKKEPACGPSSFGAERHGQNSRQRPRDGCVRNLPAGTDGNPA